ncbi:MAG TPA: type II toxin-antitoxin system HipA family toxin [Gemmatimonadales bacterium]|jgi:serine/threonine-protein kinase HipA|nr:type II toxin-antitoxin system HipA family toxin [Gemmatimonadales bacterium]
MFEVYLYDLPVGTLTPRGNGIRFQYAASALENEELPALSVSLPKQSEPFPDSRAGPFFRNLLPEQAYRRLIAGAARTAPENSVALLGAIGGECPGAVSIWPAGTTPPTEPEYQALDERALRALLEGESHEALANAVTRGRLSLPGAQDKIALLRDPAARWHLPLNGAVTSHILKPEVTRFPHLLGNELFCMELARRCDLLIPRTELAAPGVRVFCCERFDRPISGGTGKPPREKLHQEDFCQILAVEPERKYEADGGPGLRKCARVIRDHSSLPADDLPRLIRWAGFNYLIGNEDAHAKNLALLYRPDGLRLTPHYDLVSTEVYPELERRLAMKIGGAWDIRNVQRSDWQGVARAVGLPWDRVRAILLELSARIRAVAEGTGASCLDRFGPSPVYDRISEAAERHAGQLEAALLG